MFRRHKESLNISLRFLICAHFTFRKLLFKSRMIYSSAPENIQCHACHAMQYTFRYLVERKDLYNNVSHKNNPQLHILPSSFHLLLIPDVLFLLLSSERTLQINQAAMLGSRIFIHCKNVQKRHDFATSIMNSSPRQP